MKWYIILLTMLAGCLTVVAQRQTNNERKGLKDARTAAQAVGLNEEQTAKLAVLWTVRHNSADSLMQIKERLPDFPYAEEVQKVNLKFRKESGSLMSAEQAKGNVMK